MQEMTKAIAESLIDRSTFQTIMRYLVQDPRISDVLIVNDPAIDLAELGQMCHNGFPCDLEIVSDWLREGKILVVHKHMQVVFLEGETADSEVHVIRLEPTYIMKPAAVTKSMVQNWRLN